MASLILQPVAFQKMKHYQKAMLLHKDKQFNSEQMNLYHACTITAIIIGYFKKIHCTAKWCPPPCLATPWVAKLHEKTRLHNRNNKKTSQHNISTTSAALPTTLPPTMPPTTIIFPLRMTTGARRRAVGMSPMASQELVVAL